jgi:hypothetical protein
MKGALLASISIFVVAGCGNSQPPPLCSFGEFGIESQGCRCEAGGLPTLSVWVNSGEPDPWAGRLVRVCLADDEEGFNPFSCSAARPSETVVEGTAGRMELEGASCLPGWMCVELAERIGASPACYYSDFTTVISGVLATTERSCADLNASGLCSATCGCAGASCFGLSETQSVGICTEPLAPCSTPGSDERCGTDVCVYPTGAPDEATLVGRCVPAPRCEAWIPSTDGAWSCAR